MEKLHFKGGDHAVYGEESDGGVTRAGGKSEGPARVETDGIDVRIVVFDSCHASA